MIDASTAGITADAAAAPKLLEAGSAAAAGFVADIERRQKGADGKQDAQLKAAREAVRVQKEIAENTRGGRGGGLVVNF
jgi:hypothetical protein